MRLPTLATSFRFRSVVAIAVVLAGCLATALLVPLVGPRAARAAVTPAASAPRGWTTVFTDGFTGRAGTAPAAANWFYDIGSEHGTGEIERLTNSTANVYLDGRGHLVVKATHSGGTWWSGRIESARDDFAAPPGGELEMTASIDLPHAGDATGYWPAFWALGSPMRTGGKWPVSGEIDMMEEVDGLSAASQVLHDEARGIGHALAPCPRSACESGFHTYSVIVNRTRTSAEYLQFLMDGRVMDTVRESDIGTQAWQKAIDHGFYIIFDLAMGGNYPDSRCHCMSPTGATTPGAAMVVDYVSVYEKGGNSTPTAKKTASGRVTGTSGLCLANKNSLNTEGNPIVLRSCDGSAGERWSVYTDHTLRVQGGCLDVLGGGTSGGTNVDWYPCNRSAAQVWLRRSGSEFVNPHSGRCLTDPGGNTAARLDIHACAGAASQRWSSPA